MSGGQNDAIAAVIAAAGRSTRMGRLKQLLPWQQSTVIQSVVANLAEAGAHPVICVTGHEAVQMQGALRTSAATIIYNEAYRDGEMLSSFKRGIAELQRIAETRQLLGTLLSLGDQPHVNAESLAMILRAARNAPQQVVFPSYNMRRGHPFYLPVRLWPALMDLSVGETLRTLVQGEQTEIAYVEMMDDATLRDMDTPSEYAALRKAHGRAGEIEREGNSGTTGP